MNGFNKLFPGILAAYVNDTCYTLDNSECNELSKFVEGLTAELAAVQAREESFVQQIDALIDENQTALIAKNQAQSRVKRLEEATLRLMNTHTQPSWADEDEYDHELKEALANCRAALAEKP